MTDAQRKFKAKTFSLFHSIFLPTSEDKFIFQLSLEPWQILKWI